MKLIVTGATGFVGTEVIRQSLARDDITTVVAVARKPVTAPDGVGADKLRSVVIPDYPTSAVDYPDEARREFAGANGCIWTVAVIPGRKALSLDSKEVARICQDTAPAGLDAMCEAGVARPFRFMYMSGANAERDQTKKPWLLGDYSLMRGEGETKIIARGKTHEGVEVVAAKPGMINAPDARLRAAMGPIIAGLTGIHSIGVVELSRVMIDQVVGGFEKDPLSDTDLVRLAKATTGKK